MRVLFLLLACGCQAAFPITENPDAADPFDAGLGTDTSSDAGMGNDVFFPDTYIPPPPPDAGLWCGGFSDSGITYCQGTCCVKVGNGYQFTCQPKNNACAGNNYAFSCDRLTDCPQGQYCCFNESGSIEAGTYFAESHCGTCLQMESMCLTNAIDDCPDQTACHPWFSAYGQCY